MPGITLNRFGAPPPQSPAPPMLPAQKSQQVLTRDQSAYNRSEGAADFGQNQHQFMDLLGGLRTAGYMGGPGGATGASGYAGGPAGAGMGAGTWTPESVMPRQASPVTRVDTSGARAAEFARAKDQVGQTTAGAITGLRSAMAGRGTLGSGSEGSSIAGIINAGQGQLGEVSRDAAIKGAGAAEHAADMTYQGDITQRGQDIGAAEARDRNRLTARGQDLSYADAGASRSSASEGNRLASILGLWNASFGGNRY